MIPALEENFPGPSTPLVDKGGLMTQDGNFFWLKIWERTGGGSGVITNQGFVDLPNPGDPPVELPHDLNVLQNNNGDCILFSSLQPGQQQWVFNNTAFAINVFPPSGFQIDALGVGVAYSLPSSKAQVYTCFDNNLIASLQLG